MDVSVREEALLAKPRKRIGFGGLSLIFAAVLAVCSWIFVAGEEGSSLSELLSRQTWEYTVAFLEELIGVHEARPAFLDAASWRRSLVLTYETLVMSILAAGFAGAGMLLTVIPAARTAADGSLTLKSNAFTWLLFFVIRALYVAARAVPELVWAMLIVFFLSPGILPGAIALALHNFGILGKLCAEVVEDLDLRPVRALRTAGAGTFQALLYGVLPQALPQFLTYLLYRWEVIIRTTIVVGFVAAGGLGRQFRLSMSWFHFSDVALLLICYIGLVFLVDLISAGLRRLAR